MLEKSDLRYFFRAGYANCLLDEPRDMIRSDVGRLPGQDYSQDKQCELVFGPGSKICPQMEIDGKSPAFVFTFLLSILFFYYFHL